MTSPWDSLITVSDVLQLHARGILEHNQTPIAISQTAQDCVEGRIGNAWTSEGYSADEDATPGLCFAGYLLYYLTRDHCFPDGNKRAAWSAAMAVLASLGLTVNASDDEAYSLVDRIANGIIKDGMEVVYWLTGRLEAPDI
jgi:death-on-curing protein